MARKTWESWIGKTYKLKEPGVHGETARYTVTGVQNVDFGRNGGGVKPAFEVKRLVPMEGEFTRACDIFEKEFILEDADGQKKCPSCGQLIPRKEEVNDETKKEESKQEELVS